MPPESMGSAAILTYHPAHISDNDCSGNDLLALAEDLATLVRLGIPVVSLAQLITPPTEVALLHDFEGLHVAITFDDGSVFDFVDRDHPTCGRQRAAGTILAAAARES